MSLTRNLLRQMLDDRFDADAREWFEEHVAEIAAGVPDDRFCAVLSMASRHARHTALSPDPQERMQAEQAQPGWNPERWTHLETLRVSLIMARPDLEEAGVVQALDEAFRYADEGEFCALYRSLALLPQGERFSWRAGEGCRSNMTSVFEAVACDTPYPAQVFDDLAWRQMVLKAIFIGAPVWRIHGIGVRHSDELIRMSLDYVDERRSAGRAIPTGLWLCLGDTPGERGIAALELELEAPDPNHRRAALLALAVAGESERLEQHAGKSGELADVAREVLSMRRPTPEDFAELQEDGV